MRGFHGAAGHMGHIECTAAAGIDCACGRSGHLESVASGTSIGRMFDERYGRVDGSRPSVGRDVNDLCCAGDERGVDVIHDAGFSLGASLGSLANILDPEVIVLSGGVIHGKDGWRSVTWRDSIREALPAKRSTTARHADSHRHPRGRGPSYRRRREPFSVTLVGRLSTAPHLALQSSGAARRACALLIQGDLQHLGRPWKPHTSGRFNLQGVIL